MGNYSIIINALTADLFLLAAGAKMLNIPAFASALRSLTGASRTWGQRGARAVIALEAAAAALLVVDARGGAVLAAVLLLLFAVGGVYASLTRTRVACNCFGSLSQAGLDWRTAVRNLAWAALLLLPWSLGEVASRHYCAEAVLASVVAFGAYFVLQTLHALVRL